MTEDERQALLNYVASVRLKSTSLIIANKIPRSLSNTAYSWSDLVELKMTDKQWFMLGYSSGANKVASEVKMVVESTRHKSEGCNKKESAQDFLHRISEDSRWKKSK